MRRHAVDAVEAVGHLGPGRHVLVGEQVGVVARDLVREGGAELAGLHAAPAQLAVGAEEGTFVLGAAAHEVAELAARPLLDLARPQRADLQRVGVLAFAHQAGGGVQARARDDVEGDADDDQQAEQRSPTVQPAAGRKLEPALRR
jgi:hypothetical protein